MPYGYTTETEKANATIVEAQLKTSLPLIVIVCEEGILFGTLTRIPTFQKVRLVHPVGLAFAGVGETWAIEKMATGFIFRAHQDHARLGQESVRASTIMAEEERGGVVEWVKAAFANFRMRPVIGEFVLAEVGHEAHQAILYYLKYDGDREESDEFFVLGPFTTVKELEEKLAPLFEHGVPTLETAQQRISELLAGCNNEQYKMELFFLDRKHPDRLEKLS